MVDSVQLLWPHSMMEGASEERRQALLKRALMEVQAHFCVSFAELAEQPIQSARHFWIEEHGPRGEASHF
jgi:hypothetical protein